MIEKALLTAKYKVLDASLDNSPIKAIENEVITTLEKGLSRQHLHSNAIQIAYNPNVSESSPQVDEGSYQSNNSVTNAYQVGSSYIERQQRAKTYGRVQAGNESNKNIKKNPVIPAKYQHLFKNNMPGSDKYHANIKKPDGKYPNYLPHHGNIKHESRSSTDEGYSYAYKNINNLEQISNRYKAVAPNHKQNANPQYDSNNDGDAYFLDDGMEGMDIDGESTVSQIVFTEWGEDPVYDNVPDDDGVDNSNVANSTYPAHDDDDNNPDESHGNENVWKDYYYEDHEGNIVLDLSNRFDAVEMPQYMADESSRNHVDIHNNHGFYNDLDKYNADSPLSPYQDFPDDDHMYDEDYEYSNEYEETRQYDDDLLTSTEENEVTFYNNGRTLDKYDYALDISGSNDHVNLALPLNNNIDEDELVVRNDAVDDENLIVAEHADETLGRKVIDSSIGVISSPGTDIAVVTDDDGREYTDDFEEIGNGSSNVVSPVSYHVAAGADDADDSDALIRNEMQSTNYSNVEVAYNSDDGHKETSYNAISSSLEDEVRSNVDTTIVIANSPPPRQAGINSEEANSAATKLQSQVRMKQSKKRVEEMKKSKAVTSATHVVKAPPCEQAGIAIDEANSAATKLQSQVRMKQSKKRAEEMKKNKAASSAHVEDTPPPRQAGINSEEANSAATKLQSQVRMKQSKKRVEEMKKKNVVAESAVSSEEAKSLPVSNFSTSGDRNAGMELIKAARMKQQNLSSSKPVKDIPKRAGVTATSVPKPVDSSSIPQKATGIPQRKTKSVKTVKTNNSNPITTESSTAKVTSNESSNDAAIPSIADDEDQKRIMKEKRSQALALLKKKKLPNNVEIVPENVPAEPIEA